MKSILITVISLAIAGCTIAQTKPVTDSIYIVKKKYEQTKRNCIYLDTVTTEAKQVQANQKDIIAKLKAIREKQMEASTEPR